MYKKMLVGVVSLLLGSPVYAFDTTVKGKIIYTQGHVEADCRIVQFKENSTGIIRHFRIKNVSTDDDVAAVTLSALMANRDVEISYEQAVTTGCGSEPRILYITLY